MVATDQENLSSTANQMQLVGHAILAAALSMPFAFCPYPGAPVVCPPPRVDVVVPRHQALELRVSSYKSCFLTWIA